MSKLFAFEELVENLNGVELETPVEAGEVADVEVDVMEESGEIEEQADAIEEGMGASDQMEQVEELVEQAAEEGEGLDPVAAEAVRIAVEAICARVGANPKSMYALYATENFQSASSRKANTRFALEGVKEFLSELWKKIKAALQNLWTKVKAFWDKHISSLGRAKKALESMKSKVDSSSGKLKDKAFIEEAPSSLKAAFGFKGDISVKTIKEVIDEHNKFSTTSSEIIATTERLNKASGQPMTLPYTGKKLTTPMAEGPYTLVGGISVKVVTEVDEDTVSVTIERETIGSDNEVGLSLSDKSDVKDLLVKMLDRIKDDIKAKEKLVKLEESFNKFSATFEKMISKATETKAKEYRKTINVVYKLNAKTPVIINEGVISNVRLAKNVLIYAATCVKNYK